LILILGGIGTYYSVRGGLLSFDFSLGCFLLSFLHNKQKKASHQHSCMVIAEKQGTSVLLSRKYIMDGHTQSQLAVAQSLAPVWQISENFRYDPSGLRRMEWFIGN